MSDVNTNEVKTPVTQAMPKVSVTSTIVKALVDFREITGKSLSEEQIVNEAMKKGLKAMAATIASSINSKMGKQVRLRLSIGQDAEAVVRFQKFECDKIAALEAFGKQSGTGLNELA